MNGCSQIKAYRGISLESVSVSLFLLIISMTWSWAIREYFKSLVILVARMRRDNVN